MNGIRILSERLGLGWLLVPMALLVALNGVGGAAGNLSATARLPFAVGVDRYLPAAFGCVHPRYRTPWIAIAAYGVAGLVFAFLGQAGTSVRGAYDVLVSLAVISLFLPYLMLFAAMIRLQSEPAGQEVRRVPGGKPVAIALASLGLASTSVTIVSVPHPRRRRIQQAAGSRQSPRRNNRSDWRRSGRIPCRAPQSARATSLALNETSPPHSQRSSS